MAGKKTYLLPLDIVGPADINRTLIELRQVNEALDQLVLSKQASNEAKQAPKVSPPLQRLAEANKLDLLAADDREHIMAFLESLQQHAPVLHMSFASEPSPLVLEKLLDWLRNNISRYVLVQVGLQPSIAAGCILRSTNKVFDMSLRRHLQQNKLIMVDIMHKIRDRDLAAASSNAPEAAAKQGQAA